MRNGIRRSLAGLVIVAHVGGCTHLPSGQKAFDTFDQCIAANLGLATAGGFAVGATVKALARQVTGDRGTQDKVAAAAGIGAAVMIGMAAWKKCAAVYSTSEPVAQTPMARPGAAAALPPERRRAGIRFERLDVRVEGTDDDPPVPEFAFDYNAADATAKDVKAVFHHKVEIVRFKADDNDQLILADASGEAMKDSGGRPIPLANAMRMPRERLAWVTIADEGRNDYTEDVVIQPGQRSTFRHRLQVPPRAQLPIPLPVPMRYTVTVEAESHRAARTVDFALLPTSERPKRFGSSEAPVAADRPAQSPAAPASSGASSSPPAANGEQPNPASKSFEPTHTAKRSVPIYDKAELPRKSVGRVARGQPVRIDERTEIEQNKRPVAWAKIVTEDGKSGWLPVSELAEVK